MAAVRLLAALLAAGVLGLTPATSQQASDAVAPEAATAPASSGTARAPVRATSWMAAAANPLAAEAGAEILRAGGSAADAAVAVQLVLGLVEPQSSGLGGGAFVLHWDAETGTLSTLDGRETAPMTATPTLFLNEAGEPLEFFEAVVGGRSVGAPGTPRLLEELHRRHGRLAWARLFERAIPLAREGFTVSPRLATLVAEDWERLSRFDATRTYFLNGRNRPIEAGDRLANPAYADTLTRLRDGGADAFYAGEIAADIVATVRNAPGNPGVLSLQDLAAYRVKERPAVCVPYRGHEVCGMGPPSSGGLAVGQILGMLAPHDLAALGPDSPAARALIADATRLAFADRERYMADIDYVPMPLKGLTDPDYLRTRAALLKPGVRLADAEPGAPEWDHAQLFGDGKALELPSTSHFVVVDAAGDIVSMTTTIESGFGSRLMVRGFLLNNELTDFSFQTHDEGRPVANRVEPGKRPRSSMAPTIVLRDGAPVLALGSPGGSRIIPFVANTLVSILDWGMDVQAAIDAPHVVNRTGAFDLEAGTAAEAYRPALEALGYEVKVAPVDSGLHAVAITPEGLLGAADPRREGVAIGE